MMSKFTQPVPQQLTMPQPVFHVIAGYRIAKLTCRFLTPMPSGSWPMSYAEDMAWGPEGDLYIIEEREVYSQSYKGSLSTPQILRYPCNQATGNLQTDNQGNILGIPVAGSHGPKEDGNPALETSFRDRNLIALAFAPDGRLFFIADNRLRFIDGAQIVRTAAGTETSGTGGDGGPATLAQVSNLVDLAIARDGSIYLADVKRLRRISPAGIIDTVAGNLASDTSLSGDFGPGEEAGIYWLETIEVGPDGTPYFVNVPRALGTSDATTLIRRLDRDGIVRPVAGEEVSQASGIADLRDGWPARSARMLPTALAFDAFGQLTFADALHGTNPAGCTSLRQVSGQRLSVAASDETYSVLSESGSQRFVFDATGKHLRTEDARIGTVLFTFTYDQAGLLTGVTDLNGRTTHLNWDGSTTTTIVGPAGETSTLTLNPDGFLKQVVGPSGATTHMTYYDGDQAGLLHEFTLPGNNPDTQQSVLTYDDNGRLVSDSMPVVQDLDGYNVAGAKSLIQTWGENWDEVSVSTALGLVTRYLTQYLPTGEEVRRVTDPDGAWREWTRWASGDEQLEYADGRVERTEKEPDGMLGGSTMRTKQWTTTYPDGSWSRMSSAEDYTFVTSGGDWESRTTTATVDYAVPGGGTAQRVGSAVVQRLESDTGFATTTTSPGGRTTTATYDVEGRLLGTAQVGSPTTIYEWGTTGRLDSITMLGEGSAQRVVAMTYDPATDRLSSVTVAEGSTEASTTSFAEYDADGRVTQSVLPGGRVLSVGYSPLGQLETVTPPGKGSTGTHEFTYNARSEMVTYQPPDLADSQGDPVTMPTHYSYDADKRLEHVELPDGTSVVMRYHPAVGSCDALTPCTAGTCVEGACLDDDYQSVCGPTGFPPPAGHLIGVNAGPDGAIAYCYDEFARVSVALSPDAAVGFEYDGSGLLSGEATVVTDPAVTFDVARSYGPDRRLAGLSVLGTPEIVTTRDDDGLPVDVRFDWPGAAAMQLTYQLAPARALLDGTDVGAMSTSTVARDPFGMESEWAATWQDPATQAMTFDWQVTREFDGLGRITDIDEAIDTAQPSDPLTNDVHYDYDDAGRLAKVWSGQILREKYVYDDNGNRLSTELFDALGAPTDTRVGVYDLQDRLTAWTTTSSPPGVYDIGFEYGENGELSRKADVPTGGRDLQFDYDVFGNLLSVDVSDPAHPGLSSIEYRVDYRNRRIGRVPYDAQGLLLTAQTRLYAYKDQLERIAELDGDGNVLALYAYATRAHSPDLMLRRDTPTSPWGQYRMLTDHLGSVRYVVDIATGAVAQQMRYDAWGRVIEDSNPGFQPFGFAGGLYEPVTGFVRFGARDYDPEVGRWTAKDPLRFGGGDSNIYAYVNNNPITRQGNRTLISSCGAGPAR